MNTKFLFAAAALFAATTSAFAQTNQEVKDGGDKVITTTDNMKVKTKVDEDGKMKVKGKDDAGDRMKATTKPYKGKMAKEMYGDKKDGMKGDMKHHGMKHKGMKRDSTMSGGTR